MNNQPPKYWLKFFRWYCNPEYVEDIEGDLMERFEKRTNEGKWARMHFVKDVLQLFRPSMIRSLEGTQKLNYYGMIKHFIILSWRNFRRNTAQAAINIVGLSVGAAVCLIASIFYDYETSFDHQHTLSDKTFRVVQHTQRPEEELYWNTTAYPLAAALRNDFPDFDEVTQVAGPMKRLFTMEAEGSQKIKFEEEYVLFADEHYTAVFDVEWIAGNPETALSELNNVVLTESVARKCFGGVDSFSTAIGKTILLNNKDPLVISGVVKDQDANVNLRFNMLVSYQFFKKHNPYPANNWSGNYRGTTFVVLNDQAAELDIEAKINEWKGNYLNKDDDSQINYFLQPLKDIHTEIKYGSAPRSYQIDQKTLSIIRLVAAFILLVAIINFINLVTARAVTRAKEVGVRKVIGSSRTNLLIQFFLENGLLVFVSLLIAILLSYGALDFINQHLTLINIQLNIFMINIPLVLIGSLVVILLSTVYPALILSSFTPVHALSGKSASQKKGRITFRKGLTFFQFTLVQFFVIAAIVVGLQLNYFNSKSAGFISEGIVTVPIPDGEKVEVFKNRILEQHGVSNISIASGPPMAVENFGLGTTYRLPHQGKTEGMSAEMKIIDSTYLELYDLELIVGRNFINNKWPFDEFIINEKLANSMGWENPGEALGEKLMINEGEATIVGVVKDFHNQSFQNELTPLVFLNWTGFLWEASIKIENFHALVQIEGTWEGLFPENIFSYNILDESIAKEYLVEQLIYDGFKIFSILVILIGCLGLFGLMSFTTLQKTKEIGIRKVLGASVLQIVSNLNKEFSRIILFGFVIATPVVYYFMQEWLNTFTHRITMSVWIFLIGGLLTYILGSSISVVKSVKAALANPVEALKDE